MAEIKSLSRDTDERVRVMPFEEYDGEFPRYKNSQGKWVSDSEGWREFGFVAPYPTGSILTQIRRKKSEIQFAEGSASLETKDPKGLARFMVYSIFAEVIGLEEDGKPIDWQNRDNRWKEWMVTQLNKNSWLLGNCVDAYEEIAGKFKKAEKKEDEDFFDSPKGISKGSTKE